MVHILKKGFPGGSAGKESTCTAGDLGLIPGLGRSPGEGKGYPLQYSGLKNSIDCKSQRVRHDWATELNWTDESEYESCSFLSDSLQPHGLYSPWNSPGQNIGVGSLCLLQGIYPTQRLNRGLPNCRRILYQLSHKGSPTVMIRPY